MPFAAIADPTRRRILELLSERERSVGEIVERFTLSQPAISRHLGALRAAGLVEVRTVAQQRRYSLTPAGLEPIETWLARLR